MKIKKINTLTPGYIARKIENYFDLISEEKKRVQSTNQLIEELNKANSNQIGTPISSIPIITQANLNLHKLFELYIKIKYQNNNLNLDIKENEVTKTYLKNFKHFDITELENILNNLVFKNNPELEAKKQLLHSIYALFPIDYNSKFKLNNPMYLDGNKIKLLTSIISRKGIRGTETEITNINSLKNFGKVLSVILYRKNYLYGAFDFVFNDLQKDSFRAINIEKNDYIIGYKTYKNGKVEIICKDNEIAKDILNKLQKEKKSIQ